MRCALRRLLQRSGHGIIMASNGHEGLEAIREGSYDVILCDVRLPGLDGPGLYRELEQHYPYLLSRMIFLTGDVLSSEARDFFEQVGCLRLIKPFRAREVRNSSSRCWQRSERRGPHDWKRSMAHKGGRLERQMITYLW